ncbi:DUF2309 domain-containing protein [Schinkia sp. CFF1]
MGVPSALSKEPKIQNQSSFIKKINLPDIVKSASRVIVPLSPISTFAARNPWIGLEEQSFEQVARWLKNIHDIDIFPNARMVLNAKSHDEIDEEFLKAGLERWLDSQSFNFPREYAERFCRAALKLEELPANLMESEELKKLASKFKSVKLRSFETEKRQPLSVVLDHTFGMNVTNGLNHQVIKWCKLYSDDSQAGWTMPNKEIGFYRAWHQLIQHDPALSRKQRKYLKDWPKEANIALEKALSALRIPQSDIQNYLEGHLLQLPGWAGILLWRAQENGEEYSRITEYLAVRISLEWALVKPYLHLLNQGSQKKDSILALIVSWIHWGELSIEEWSRLSFSNQTEYIRFSSCFDHVVRRKLWLEAWEQTYEYQLRGKITSRQGVWNKTKFQPPLAQFAFCIDVRSEPFRRQLEQEGPFETYGVAGFFGLPISTSKLGSHSSHSSLPIILKPKHKVIEITSDSEQNEYKQRRQVVQSIGYTFKKMKQNVLANLLLPELSGPWLSLQMLGRSFFPQKAGSFIRQVRDSWLSKPKTNVTLDHVYGKNAEIPIGFSEEEKVNYVRQSLKMMGLTNNFAPLVVICGHGSHSTNNPYGAALDCGACGGAAGGFNARVLATLCNLPKVRESLSMEGIKIPEETVFIAAEHITTVDELKWLYVPELSNPAQEAFALIEAILSKVSQNSNAVRLSKLPNLKLELKNPKVEAHRLAEDWSEVRPEWGLARNAAFIIGRRELTQDCDLEGRVFLHNYDWKQDESGEILANIMKGPATVAQMINLQYYASTVAPHYYGSGNKATQTVTAGLGVMQGNASDLLAGLPWQSVMKSDSESYHSPLRLLIVIEAPSGHVERLLNADSATRQKVQNGWVRLTSIDQEGHWINW